MPGRHQQRNGPQTQRACCSVALGCIAEPSGAAGMAWALPIMATLATAVTARIAFILVIVFSP
jgi:hypothetical protein